MRSNSLNIAIAAWFIWMLAPGQAQALDAVSVKVGETVAHAIGPVMQQYGVPGMAVGIVIGGRRYVYDYGLASRATGRRVTPDTLFEIGSISKTFTATLASFAQVTGKLSLSDHASSHLASLRGSSFDEVSLVNLGTHTPGGLPLQVPDGIENNDELMAYFRSWKPAHPPGTFRTYSNLSIGMLGMITAQSMHGDFVALMQNALFPWLGMKSTWLDVPETRMKNYAQGYTTSNTPVRVAPGVLAPETYGVKTTADDLLRFVEANMGMLDIDPKLQAAIMDTHTGYYRVGSMTQDLIWEQYAYPVELETLLSGNSAKIILEANPATELRPPMPPREDVLIDKTGSTNGFAAYVAFVPRKKIGIVLLANKSYPIDERVRAAYAILRCLDDARP